MRWSALLAVALVGCASGPKSVVVPRDVLVVCPPEPPEVHCPEWPAGPGATVQALMLQYLEGSLAHTECRVAVRAWEASWTACRAGLE